MDAANRARYCLTAHVGGYGDCLRAPGHTGTHEDAHFHRFTDEDNARIMAHRLSMRAAADRRRSMAAHPAGKGLALREAMSILAAHEGGSDFPPQNFPV